MTIRQILYTSLPNTCSIGAHLSVRMLNQPHFHSKRYSWGRVRLGGFRVAVAMWLVFGVGIVFTSSVAVAQAERLRTKGVRPAEAQTPNLGTQTAASAPQVEVLDQARLVYIKNVNVDKVSKIELYNMEGRRMNITTNSLFTQNKIEIPLTTITRGTYNLTFIYDNAPKTEKIVLKEEFSKSSFGGGTASIDPSLNLPDPVFDFKNETGNRRILISKIEIPRVIALDVYNLQDGRRMNITGQKYETTKEIELPLNTLTVGMYNVVVNYNGKEVAYKFAIADEKVEEKAEIDPSLNLPDPVIEYVFEGDKRIKITNVETKRVGIIELYNIKDGTKKGIVPQRFPASKEILIPLTTITRGQYNLVYYYNGKRLSYQFMLEDVNNPFAKAKVDPSKTLADPVFKYVSVENDNNLYISNVDLEYVTNVELINAQEGRKMPFMINKDVSAKQMSIPLNTITRGKYNFVLSYNGKRFTETITIGEK